MFEILDWQFSVSAFSLIGCSLALIITFYLSYQSCKLNNKKGVFILEVIRVFSVCFILLILLNPERIEVIKRNKKPQIVCLLDESKSMNTRDISHPDGTIQSRSEWINEIINLDWIKNLEQNASVSLQPFSSRIGKGFTDISNALEKSIQGLSNIKALILFSDGESNTGNSLLSMAAKLRGLNIPVFNIQTGSRFPLPDLSLEELEAPAFVLREEKIILSYRINNYFQSPKQTKINLLANGRSVDSKIVTLEPLSDQTGTLTWQPSTDGNFTLQVKVEKITGESIDNNNEKKIKTEVKNKIIKTLLIDALPRWEYRFLKNALERDPRVDLKCILFHPDLQTGKGENYLSRFPEEFNQLAPFDVIFIGDVGLGSGELNHKNCENLKKLIELQASGIVFLPGKRGRQNSLKNSALKNMLPVILDDQKPSGLGTINPSSIELTNRGQKHWLTNLRGSGEPDREFWERLPGFHWSAVVEKSRPGSEVLAVHSNFKNEWGRMPILAIRYSGAGKSLFMGSDSAWRWRRGVEDKYHYRFWSQIVRWMAHGRYLAEQDGIRLITTPESPKAGDVISLRCIAMDKDGFPLENGRVTAFAIHSDGTSEKIEFHPIPEGPGVYLSQVQSFKPGIIRMDLKTEPFVRSLQLDLPIAKNEKEKVGKPVTNNQLLTLCEITGGKSVDFKNWKKAVDQLAVLPNPEPVTKIHRLRASIPWGVFIFSLFTLYWAGRKIFGML